jgi:solute carrier family 35 (adenosine 3'-phospho 5'-phosphosulfate transporter), member B2
MSWKKKLKSIKMKEESEPKVSQMLMTAGSLITFFLMYGVLQERIMTMPYGPNGEMFTQSAFLVLNNRIVAVLVSAVILYWQGEDMRNPAPLYKYFGIAFSNTAATFCQYEALKFVSFPTQTLGKCAKMIPVLILSSVLSLRKYGAKDYFVALMVTIGCAMFVLGGDTAAKKGKGETDDSLFGLLLMGGYLFLDGFTSTFQEKLFKDYKMSSSFNQMMYNNICSGLLSLVALVFSGQLVPAIEFSIANPDFYINAIGLSLAACLGQIVIYYTIRNFGALFFSMCMVTRQVISILLSCLLFLHPLTGWQWLSSAIVFGTIYWSKASKRRSKPSAPPLPTKEASPQQV